MNPRTRRRAEVLDHTLQPLCTNERRSGTESPYRFANGSQQHRRIKTRIDCRPSLRQGTNMPFATTGNLNPTDRHVNRSGGELSSRLDFEHRRRAVAAGQSAEDTRGRAPPGASPKPRPGCCCARKDGPDRPTAGGSETRRRSSPADSWFDKCPPGPRMRSCRNAGYGPFAEHLRDRSCFRAGRRRATSSTSSRPEKTCPRSVSTPKRHWPSSTTNPTPSTPSCGVGMVSIVTPPSRSDSPGLETPDIVEQPEPRPAARAASVGAVTYTGIPNFRW